VSWLTIGRALVSADAKRIARDRFLAFIFGYGVILSLVVRFAAAPLSRVLMDRYGIDLPPHYPLIASFVALTLGSTMVGIVLGFVLLEARESRVLEALAVSPLTFRPYLGYRLGVAMALAVGLNPACAAIAGIGLPSLGAMLAIGAGGMLFAAICTLALATFSDNKVQAFAVMKTISGASMLPLAAYFVDEPLQYLFGLFPPYWLVKAWWVAVAGGPWWVHLTIGLLTNGAMLLWMARRFEAELHRAR
jgi:fluoroquinolone transport system permease protein